MLELRTEIEIDAPAERVWAVLLDFERFPDWNPFIRSIRGQALVGSRLEVLLGASGTRPMRFRPTVKAVVPNRELRWLGRLGLPRLFDRESAYDRESLRDRPCLAMRGHLRQPHPSACELQRRRGLEGVRESRRHGDLADAQSVPRGANRRRGRLPGGV